MAPPLAGAEHPADLRPEVLDHRRIPDDEQVLVVALVGGAL